MLGSWETKLNKKYIKEVNMNLDTIFNKINKKNRIFLLNPKFSTIRYINEEEYNNEVYEYVEPIFYEESGSEYKENSPKFIIISAPGATGKTALAKHICYTYNGIYWDLPDTKVAEYSFQGTIMQAVGSDKISSFIQSLVEGSSFLVVDAFDEAETGSGRTGIEFFLRDFNNITVNNKDTCAVLLARTESALFIKKYFEDNNIAYNHYEVSYFEEANAKTYIKNGLKKRNIPITDIVDECIEAQFKEIKRILMNKNTSSFLGYAPVLNALSTSYDEERNTLNLLKNTSNSENNCSLLKKIMDCLLIREREKFIRSLKIKLPNIANFSDDIYSPKEQILRIFGQIMYNDSTFFIDTNSYKSIPSQYYDEYLEAINAQLPQHPFIKCKGDNDIRYDFTGIVFSDYVIANILSLEDFKDFAREYISDKKYNPSPLLIEFYSIFSNNSVSGKDIALMYNSLKAHTQTGDKSLIYINGDKEECSVEFVLERDNKKYLLIEFMLNDIKEGIYINQLSNCYIDVEADVYIGTADGEARIYNSTINCNKIVWCGNFVSIEAYSPGECSLTCNEMMYVTQSIPKFEIKIDDSKNFKVYCDSLKGYFKLLPYYTKEINNDDTDDFIVFSNVVRRIFSCLRSHSKDAPARKMDFINNRIINKNEKKEKILNFLLERNILYTDEQDWLYKLKTDELSTYSIKWNSVREGDFDSLKILYNEYITI